MSNVRLFGISSVSVDRIKIRNEFGALSRVRDYMNLILKQSNFLERAPFDWIQVVIHNVPDASEEIVMNRINKRYGDLSVTVKLDANELYDLGKLDEDRLYEKYLNVSISVLRDVARKYQLDTKFLEYVR